jgi:parallel beta-helix repeat protein
MARANSTKLLGSLFLALALTLAAAHQLKAGETTYGVGACGLVGVTSYSSITEALEATPAPDLIEVCPGTYYEQLIITKSVTIKGINPPGSTANQVILIQPSGGFKSCPPFYGNALVCVYDASPVNISNMTIDGCCGFLTQAGIFYGNASGTLNQVELRNEGVYSGSGIATGMGIVFEPSQPETLTIENSNLHDVYPVAIYAQDRSPSGHDMTLNIEGNTVKTDPFADSIGVWTTGGASVTLSGNIISDSASCTGCEGVKLSIPAAGSITKNTLVGMGTGIELGPLDNETGALSVTSNTIFDSVGDAILFDSGLAGVTIEDNVITQAHNGIDLACVSGNTVSSNTLSAIHSIGLASVPGSQPPAANTYSNTATQWTVCE